MGRQRRRHPALEGIDAAALAEFRAGLRRRYTDEEILAELRASAVRLGRSPTMREFAGDPEAGVHPQTVIEHFGTWNAAKRAAGLQPRRFISREELVDAAAGAGGGARAHADGARHRGAPRPDGVEVADLAHVRLARGGAQRGRLRRPGGRGAARAGDRGRGRPRAGSSGTCRRWPTGRSARARDATLLSEWQVYRLVDVNPGAWSAFQFLVSQRLREEGVEVRADGTVEAP